MHIFRYDDDISAQMKKVEALCVILKASCFAFMLYKAVMIKGLSSWCKNAWPINLWDWPLEY